MNRPELEFPEVDAKDVAAVFKQSGYDVDLLLGKEATQAAIRKTLKALGEKGNSDGVVVLGFFGHGLDLEFKQVNGGSAKRESCFCPFDTRITTVKDSKGQILNSDRGEPLKQPDPESIVKISEILTAIRISPMGNRMLFFDCNRTVPNQARGRGFGDEDFLLQLPSNTAVLFACSQNERSFEHGNWKHGAFAKCLIDELTALKKDGRVFAGTLADRVQQNVKQLVGMVLGGRERQTPQFVATNVVDLQMDNPKDK